ncbi:MAG: nucleoside-triphosphatase [Saprospiraceae bacterium]
MSKVVVITGPIRSGKTSFLCGVFRGRVDTGGFLCPDINGVRTFEHLAKGEVIPFEVKEPLVAGQNVTTIGKFRFRSEVFTLANQLLYDFSKSNHKYFIIDEIGKLELKGAGLHEGLDFLFSNLASLSSKSTVICVIRKDLLEKVLAKYQIKNPTIHQLNGVTNFNQISLLD